MNVYDLNEKFFNVKRLELYDLINCYKNTIPYYKVRWQFNLPTKVDDFNYDYFVNTIPLLDPEIVKDNSNKFISDLARIDDLVVETTSGTDGKPLNCYKSKSETILFSRILWDQRIQRSEKIKITDKVAAFYTTRNKGNIANREPIVYEGNSLLLSLFDLSEFKLEMYWSEILNYRPRWMRGSPSAIYNLATVFRKKKLPVYNFELIELRGEYVSEEDIAFIKDTFTCEVSNLYGTREIWPIAYSCSEGHLHILDKRVFVETRKNNTYGNSEIILTGLRNFSWGLVRYKIGDLGDLYYLDESKCGYLNNFCLSITKGRKAEYLRLDNGKVFGTIFFSTMCQWINKIGEKRIIKQYQLIKMSGSHLRINLACDSTLSDKAGISDYIRNEFEKTVGQNIILEFNFVDYIPHDNDTGKFKEFIDLTKGN